MKQNIMLTRASLAGLVWAVVFGLPYTLHGLMDGETRTGSFVGGLFLMVLIILFLSALGLVLALPYAAFLAAWETRARPNDRRFLIGSILICGTLVAVPASLYGLMACDLIPVSGFTGNMRVAMVHFVAALAAGYAVGRYLPQTGDNPAVRVYQEYRVWLWAEYCLGILVLLSPFLFPTFGSSFSIAAIR